MLQACFPWGDQLAAMDSRGGGGGGGGGGGHLAVSGPKPSAAALIGPPVQS